MSYYQIIDDTYIILSLYIQPGAKKPEVCGIYNNDSLKIKLSAKPIDGQANDAVIMFIQNWLNVTKSQIKIISGDKSRYKKVRLDNKSKEIINKLEGMYK